MSIIAIIENQELRALHILYYFKAAPFWFRLFLNSPNQVLAYLIKEVEETAFWMEQGNILAVANMQQNHIAMAANRLKGFARVNLLEAGRANLQPCRMTKYFPFCYFKTSPEVSRLALISNRHQA